MSCIDFSIFKALKVLHFDMFFEGLNFNQKVVKKLWIIVTACC